MYKLYVCIYIYLRTTSCQIFLVENCVGRNVFRCAKNYNSAGSLNTPPVTRNYNVISYLTPYESIEILKNRVLYLDCKYCELIIYFSNNNYVNST